MNSEKIGKFIAELRKEKGLTQLELGNKLYVTDKAVSKWERGLSFPDISLLEKLASELDVTIEEILLGHRKVKEKIDVKEEIEKIEKEIKRKQKNRTKILVITIITIIIILLYTIFRNTYLGFDTVKVKYAHMEEKEISLGIPKLSFMKKYNDRSYSFKNLRSSNVIEKELKDYLKELEYLTCNDTIYYYDKDNDFSIINYSVKNHYLHSTVSYEIVDYDYCNYKKISDIKEKLGVLRSIHYLNDKINLEEDWQFKLQVVFIDGIDVDPFSASLEIKYYEKKANEHKNAKIIELEKSEGSFELIDDMLIYTRNNIIYQKEDLKIPEVSIFKIKTITKGEKSNLVLVDNYLSKYYDEEIILE